jgi:hypothetical protein
MSDFSCTLAFLVFEQMFQVKLEHSIRTVNEGETVENDWA